MKRKIKPVYKAIETRIRKETAEKIFKELKEKHTEVYNKYVFAKSSEYDDLEINAIINFSDSLYFAFDEICKEITEGLK